MQKDGNNAIFARLDDLVAKSARGEIAYSGFMSMRESRIASDYLNRSGVGGSFLAFGGYRDAERKRIFILPDYIDAENYEELLPYLDNEPTVALEIVGSGYRKFSHRDVLGSLLSLGIERDVLGDIVFKDESGFSSIVFCDSRIADYIRCELTRVANDAVKIIYKEVDYGFEPYRSFLHISDTVSSARIDSVVAAICSLSREKARSAVEGELVEVDFMVESRPDKQISAPCTVSVRGYGRFRINSVSEQTKKGRFRLNADKYL